MPRVRNKEVTRLLRQGLNHYGLADLAAAIDCWERARTIDPENHAVHDYLESAYHERGQAKELDDDATPVANDDTGTQIIGDVRDDMRDDDRDDVATVVSVPVQPTASTASDPEDTIADALTAYKAGELDIAWAGLQQVCKEDPERLDVQGYLQLVGNARVEKWSKEIGDQGRVLHLKCTTEEMMKLKLHPDEGFLLSQIDGKVSIADLLSVSTWTRQRTLEVLARLLREKIVA
ncbi:MAG: hypothetical protein V3V67_01425 [Myxococcota bacterium]